jgi:hypothetical protein
VSQIAHDDEASRARAHVLATLTASLRPSSRRRWTGAAPRALAPA